MSMEPHVIRIGLEICALRRAAQPSIQRAAILGSADFISVPY
jgi:hypothetical protein